MGHYPLAIEGVYENNPGLENKPYEEQMRALFAQGLFYSDSFSKAMRALGNEASDIVYDAKIAQETWARENGFPYEPRNWRHEILLGQIESIKPDVVYYQGGNLFPEEIQKTFLSRFPFVRLVALNLSFLIPPGECQYYDLIIVGAPKLKRQLHANGIQSHVIYHSFDQSVLARLDAQDTIRDIGFSFIGSSGCSYPAMPETHWSRYKMLSDLLERTDLQVWEMGRSAPDPSFVEHISRISKILAQGGLNRVGETFLRRLVSFEGKVASNAGIELIKMARGALNAGNNGSGHVNAIAPSKCLRDLYPDKCRDAVFGMDMYRVLARSRVTLNIHTVAADGEVGNMRMFEATGVGACLLTDDGTNMADLFDKDREIVTYSSLGECEEKAAYLLEHDSVREQIARAGQERTLRDHTPIKRCGRIHELILERLRGPRRAGVPLATAKERLTPLNIATMVMTEREAGLYTGVALPCHLSMKNLPSLQDFPEVSYTLFAPDELAEGIKNSPAFNRLAKILPVSISTGGFERIPHNELRRARAMFQRTAIMKAAETRAALVMLAPDIILSDGTFPKLYEMAARGKKYLALAPDVPVDGDFSRALMGKDGNPDNSSRRLAKLALRHPSGAIRWKSGGGYGVSPARLKHFWKAGDCGMLVRSYDWLPLLIWPRSVSYLDWNKLDPEDVDTDVYYDTAPKASDVEFITDSDDILLLRLVDADASYCEPDLASVNRFRLNAHGADHRRYSHHKYYMRVKDGQTDWETAELESDRIIGRINSRLEAKAALADLASFARYSFKR